MSPFQQCTLFTCCCCWKYFTPWTCSSPFKYMFSMSCTVWYWLIYTRTHFCKCVHVSTILILNRHNKTCTSGTILQQTFTVSRSMYVRLRRSHFCQWKCLLMIFYMTTIWNSIMIIGFKNTTFSFTISSVLIILGIVCKFF